jgi:pimeloyl-ACP methyl ester carboxylesterase
MKLQRDGIALGYADAGDGAPPIALVHGWATDRGVMAPLFEHLQRAHRVVSVDLRGFGDSDAPRQSYTIRGYADDLAHMIAELDLTRPVVIGHSMGGLIALDLAARHPDQVSAVVILESMVAAADTVVAGLRPVLDGVRSGAYRDVLTGLMTYLTGPHFDPTARARLVQLAASCPQHVLVSAMQDMLDFDSAAAAARVRCPLLYVGTATPYADLARLRALCPQLVTGQLVGCGHYFPLEVPDQLHPMVDRFLQTQLGATTIATTAGSPKLGGT